MNPDLDFSPAPLSYVAALRGIRPRSPGDAFAYAEVIAADPARLICLAASNPEGQFYGLLTDVADKTEAEKLARARQTGNVTFLEGSLEDRLRNAGKNGDSLPSLNYLCCDERKTPLSSTERTALFSLAESKLLPGGLLAYSYRAYEKDGDALQFLVRECAPQLDAAQAVEFLHELKKLGASYLASHSDTAKKLDDAIVAKMPDRFFSDFDKGTARSGSFDTIVALRPRGFVYAGDANIGMNYIEWSAPTAAQPIIVECRDNHLYEPVKDFALNRQERCDVWCRQPATRTANSSELFGNFVYGITRARKDVPQEIRTEGSSVNLEAPLFAKLIDLMTLIPLGIGDFLSHPDGKSYAPADVLAAIQILVACGLAQPMRGHYRNASTNIEQPRFTGTFNQHIDKMPLTGERVWMASPVAGGAVAVSARDALVMQALNRVGLANSVSALLPELERLAKDPASAAQVMDAAAPTAEIATNMIKNSVSESIVQWYAYGLLAAA